MEKLLDLHIDQDRLYNKTVINFNYFYRNRKKHQGYHCNICGDCLTSQNDVTKAVSCSRCSAFVCRQGCAYEKSQNYWICLACSKTVQSWYKNILDVIQPTTNKRKNKQKNLYKYSIKNICL